MFLILMLENIFDEIFIPIIIFKMLCYSWASCSDGIQNQDETDVDCGGMSCPACARNLLCFFRFKKKNEIQKKFRIKWKETDGRE